jgi:CDGSH-type Zn-finger protein
VVCVPGGPLLVEGPVEIELEDGSTAASDRFMVAVCRCGRSACFPWCDTTHRVPGEEPSAGRRRAQ